MGVFLCEVTVKMLAEGTAPWLFFKSGCATGTGLCTSPCARR